jgi:hypothetical protein
LEQKGENFLVSGGRREEKEKKTQDFECFRVLFSFCSRETKVLSLSLSLFLILFPAGEKKNR